MEEEENQGGVPQTDEFGRPINNSGELDTQGQKKSMNELPSPPPKGEEENQGGAPQTDEFGRTINNSGELDTQGQKKGMNELPSPPQEEEEDHYSRMYRLYARQQPKAPDYRNEKAERFGRLLGDTFKMVADSIGVGINAHTVAPLDSDKHYKDIADREEQKRLKYEQELAQTDDANRNLALQLEKMRRDDEFAKEKAEAAAAQFRMKYGQDQKRFEFEQQKLAEQTLHHRNIEANGAANVRARANGAATKAKNFHTIEVGKKEYDLTADSAYALSARIAKKFKAPMESKTVTHTNDSGETVKELVDAEMMDAIVTKLKYGLPVKDSEVKMFLSANRGRLEDNGSGILILREGGYHDEKYNPLEWLKNPGEARQAQPGLGASKVNVSDIFGK